MFLLKLKLWFTYETDLGRICKLYIEESLNMHVQVRLYKSYLINSYPRFNFYD